MFEHFWRHCKHQSSASLLCFKQLKPHLLLISDVAWSENKIPKSYGRSCHMARWLALLGRSPRWPPSSLGFQGMGQIFEELAEKLGANLDTDN